MDKILRIDVGGDGGHRIWQVIWVTCRQSSGRNAKQFHWMARKFQPSYFKIDYGCLKAKWLNFQLCLTSRIFHKPG